VVLELIKTKLGKYDDDLTKQNQLREFLQLLTLKSLEENGYFRDIAFVGGTALRIIYDLNRFSEDLDFSLFNSRNYDFDKIIESLERTYKQNNLKVSMRLKPDKTVNSAFIRFENLLYDLGLSPLRDQKLSIKLEVDTNPPAASKSELSMVNKNYVIAINHYDLPSLFAGKCHALLFRKYAKGRDYYDLLWYLSKGIEPNYALLENAISQTESKEIKLNSETCLELLKERIREADFKKILNDLEPFLLDPSEAKYFNKEHFLSVLKF